MVNITKERAVSRVLLALESNFNIARSRFGTLGGAGYELAVWERLGVPLANCWIIERDPHAARRLIARARAAHHFVGRLRDFPYVFRSMHPGGTLDVFHWDLCETVEPNARELRYIFPVIAGSESRCLLVTCADQRRNRSLDEADLLDAWWTWLLGGADAFREFRTALERQGLAAQQRGFTEAEAANATTRELSVYLHLLLVMGDFRYENEVVLGCRSMGLAALDRTRGAAGRGRPFDIGAAFAGGREPAVTFLPDALVRVVYYSRAHTAVRPGFRMRTLGMHLARLTHPLPLRVAAQQLAAVVTRTPLQMVVPGRGDRVRIVTISAPAVPRGRRTQLQKEEKAMAAKVSGGAAPAASPNENPFERLSAETDAFATQLAKRLHAAARFPTDRVVALAREAMAQLRVLDEIDQRLHAHEEASRTGDRLREVLDMGTNGAPTTVTPAPAATGAQSGNGSRDMTEAQRDALRLRLIRARDKGVDAYAAEKAAVAGETHLAPRAIASLTATTSGKFAPNFLRRVCVAIPKGDARRALAAELQTLGYGKSSKEKKALAPYLR